MGSVARPPPGAEEIAATETVEPAREIATAPADEAKVSVESRDLNYVPKLFVVLLVP